MMKMMNRESIVFDVTVKDLRLTLAVAAGLTVLQLSSTVPLHAQMQFGDPVKTANINVGPPVGEGGPHFSPDGLSIYFHSSQRPGAEYPDGVFYLYVATRGTVDDPWNEPEPLPIALNQGGDSGPSLSSDDLSLYFGRGDDLGLARGADIFVATRETTSSPWDDPQPVSVVNATSWSDLTPEISSSGLELYFSSDRPGGLAGAPDLWVSRRASLSDPWSDPENLVDINTSQWESGPDLSDDGLTLFFNVWPISQQPRSSDFDLWMTHRQTLTSPWDEPTRLPDAINDSGALAPHLTPDGSTLYFARTLLDTTDLRAASEDLDIWQVSVTPEFAPGDFNFNGILDVDDVDLLSAAARAGDNDPAFDLNEDRMVDDADRTVWVRDLKNTWFGDANLDGEFETRDLVMILASGVYEADVDSGWATGDFDGDGRTNTSDLVAALADGGYEQGPRQAVAAVPEPAGAVLLALGILTSSLSRRRLFAIRS